MLFSQAVQGESLDSASFDTLRTGLSNLNRGCTGRGLLDGRPQKVNTPNGVCSIPGGTALYRPKALYATRHCAGDQKEWKAEKKWCGNASNETARSLCRLYPSTNSRGIISCRSKGKSAISSRSLSPVINMLAFAA